MLRHVNEKCSSGSQPKETGYNKGRQPSVWVPENGTQRHFAWHSHIKVDGREGAGLGLGLGLGLHCLNKDQAPCDSPTIHAWHSSILQVEVLGVLGILSKNVANP